MKSILAVLIVPALILASALLLLIPGSMREISRLEIA